MQTLKSRYMMFCSIRLRLSPTTWTSGNYSGILARLFQDLRGDMLGVAADDAAGVDQLEQVTVVLGDSMNTVAGDAGLVADDGAALADDGVEERRFPDVGTAHDDDGGQRLGGRHKN